MLLAHDHKKGQLIDLAICYRDVLTDHQLLSTPTTGRLLQEMVGLTVQTLSGGLDGNDDEIAERISDPELWAVIFLVDATGRRAHEPRVERVLEACSLYDVPLATNAATAGAVLNLLSVLSAAGAREPALLDEK
jgi:methylglyoxal synthase